MKVLFKKDACPEMKKNEIITIYIFNNIQRESMKLVVN